MVSELGVGEGGAPIGGAEVVGVLGEDPAVVVEIVGSVLALAVDGLVELFPYGGLLLLSVAVVGGDVGDDDREVLGAGAEGCGALGVGTDAADHDVGVAEVELHATADGVAITEVLGELEDTGEPGGCGEVVAVDDVWDEGGGGDAAVGHKF